MRLPGIDSLSGLPGLPGVAEGRGHPGEHPGDPLAERLTLGPGEVHLWYAPYDVSWDLDRLAGYRALMNPSERARCDRFVFERDRLQFTITRGLVRTVLSRYADVAPAAWCFVDNQYGKPRIDIAAVVAAEANAAADARGLFFNLSNTRGLIVCAVTRTTPEIGVDVEQLDRTTELLAIADRFFSPSEVAALRRLPADQQKTRFFAYWTLKESYIKARGMGLSLPLDQFSFTVAEERPLSISFDPRLDDRPETWTFWLGRWTTTHYAALGVRHTSTPVLLRARRWPG